MIDHADNDHPGPIDAELRSLLDDARSRDALDPAFEEPARERVLGRVEQVLDRAPGAARGGFGLRSGVMAVSVALIAALAGGKILGGDAGDSSDARAPVASAIAPQVAIARPGAPPTAPAPAQPQGDAVPLMRIDELPSPPTPAPARSSRIDSSRGSAPSGTDLAEEYRLVDGARAKVAAKDYTGALQSVREHEKRFPSGQLNQERESLYIQALVETGRIPEARERAERFRTRFPSGLLLPTVARAIASSAPDSATR